MIQSPTDGYLRLGMLGFLDQDMLDIILSAEVIFSVVFTVALFFVVHTLLSFLRVTGPLHTRLTEVEAQLDVMQASIPVRIARLAELRRSMQPLEDDFKEIRAYHARLIYLERRAEKKELEKEKEEEEDRPIGRRRRDFE